MRNVFISAEVIFYIWILNSEKSWTPKYILAQGFDCGYAMCYVSDVLLRSLWFKNREIRPVLRILNMSLKKAKVGYFWNANLAMKGSLLDSPLRKSKDLKYTPHFYPSLKHLNILVLRLFLKSYISKHSKYKEYKWIPILLQNFSKRIKSMM